MLKLLAVLSCTLVVVQADGHAGGMATAGAEHGSGDGHDHGSSGDAGCYDVNTGQCACGGTEADCTGAQQSWAEQCNCSGDDHDDHDHGSSGDAGCYDVSTHQCACGGTEASCLPPSMWTDGCGCSGDHDDDDDHAGHDHDDHAGHDHDDDDDDSNPLESIDWSTCIAIGNCTAACTSEPTTCSDVATALRGCASGCPSCVGELINEALGCSGSAPKPKKQIVKIEMTASGSVEDYSEDDKADIATIFADEAGVAVDKVKVTITSASVNIAIEIEAESESVAAVVESSLGAVMADASTATAFLQQAVPTITVESAPTMATAAAPSGKSDSNMGGIIGGAVGGVLCAIGIVAGVMQMRKKQMQVKVGGAAPTVEIER